MTDRIEAEIARELNDPRSPWTHTELHARLEFVREARNFSRFLDEFSEVFSEFPENVS